MGKVITISLQKGGVGKSTTTGIVAHLMAQDGFKVLAIDMDSQGNLTGLLSGIEADEFGDRTIFEALRDENIKPYIARIKPNIHLVAGNDNLAFLSELIYVEKGLRSRKDVNLLLDSILEPVKDHYDFILIDTPPSLAEPMRNAITASDYLVIPAETAKYSFKAIEKLIDTAEAAKKYIKHDLEVIGILRTMSDSWNNSKAFVELIGEEYPDLCFDTVIKRNAATGRVAVNGLNENENKEIKKAVGKYEEFYNELKERLGVSALV